MSRDGAQFAAAIHLSTANSMAQVMPSTLTTGDAPSPNLENNYDGTRNNNRAQRRKKPSRNRRNSSWLSERLWTWPKKRASPPASRRRRPTSWSRSQWESRLRWTVSCLPACPQGRTAGTQLNREANAQSVMQLPRQLRQLCTSTRACESTLRPSTSSQSTTRQCPRSVCAPAGSSDQSSFFFCLRIIQPVLDILAEMIAHDKDLKLESNPSLPAGLEAMLGAMPPTVGLD